MAERPKLSDDELNALIETDPLKALCYLVEEAGGTMRLYGKPVTEEELRAGVEKSANERIKAAICRGIEKELKKDG
jgi:formate-dependent phosphoribosylglycinamide formyltransferase (GAR transformylase)